MEAWDTGGMARQLTALFFFLLYIIPRFIFDGWFRSLAGYQSYYIEAAYLITVAIAFRPDFGLGRLNLKRDPLWALAFLFAGFIVEALAHIFKLPIPFRIETSPLAWDFIILFLIIGPLLEELIFRWALWDMLKRIHPLPNVRLLVTSALFALAHLLAWATVPEELHSFVAFQGFYTFCLALALGAFRLRARSVWVAFLFHALFNLGFGLGLVLLSDAHAETKTQATTVATNGVLVVDMSVESALIEDASLLKQLLVLEPTYPPSRLEAESCEKDLSVLEDLLLYRLGKAQFQHSVTPQLEVRLQKSVFASHGYHILSLVAEGLTSTSLYYLGVHAPPLARVGIVDVDAYINEHIGKDIQAVRQALQTYRIRLVNISSSDSYQENKEDLMTGGWKQAEAEAQALRIMEAWKQGWLGLLAEFPEVTFVVPSGNGSTDWVGDKLDGAKPQSFVLPAMLPNKNLVKVASLAPTECLSAFSNYHPDLVDVAVSGEEVSARVPCATKPRLKLTGTSQSTALMTHYLAASFEKEGLGTREAIGRLPGSPCLRGKITNAKYLPARGLSN